MGFFFACQTEKPFIFFWVEKLFHYDEFMM